MRTRANQPTPPPPIPLEERLLSVADVLARIPIHRSTLNAMLRAKRFPPPLNISSSKLLWRWTTIDQWLIEREQHPVGRREFRFKPGEAPPKPKPRRRLRSRTTTRRSGRA